jgi:eukaryotic-like serine/threonine-protein kinase
MEKVVDGRFRLVAQIGEGAHGHVWKAFDQVTGKEVAVKLLRDAAQDPEYCVRMVREAKAMSQLAGTAAIAIVGSGTDDDGAFYIAMELLVGEDLEDHLTRMEREGARMSPAMVLWMLKPIVDTLDLAHGRGIVHRDLKPGNIFLLDRTRGGGVRLLDFGLVKLMKAKALTRQGIVAGSPSYIAPEAWKGDPTLLDHRIDVYALGAIVFRALAGRVPFDGDSIGEKLVKATTAPRPSLHALRPDLPADLDWWVQQTLAIDPNQRFLRVTSMWSALRQILA